MAITIGNVSEKYGQGIDPLTISHDQQANNLLIGGAVLRSGGGQGTLFGATYNAAAMAQIGTDLDVAHIEGNKWYYLASPAQNTNDFDVDQDGGDLAALDTQWCISIGGAGAVLGEYTEIHAQSFGNGFNVNYVSKITDSLLIAFWCKDNGSLVTESGGEAWVLKVSGSDSSIRQQVWTLQTTTPGTYNITINNAGSTEEEILRIIEIAPAGLEYLDPFEESAPITDITSHELVIPSGVLWANLLGGNFKLDDVNSRAFIDFTFSNDWHINRPASVDFINSYKQTIIANIRTDLNENGIGGVGLRCDASQGLFALQGVHLGGFGYHIFHKVGSAMTRVQFVSGSWSPNVYYDFRFEAIEGTGPNDVDYEFFRDDISVASGTITDATLRATVGRPAIACNKTGSWNSSRDLRITSMEAGSEKEPTQPKAFADSAAGLPGSSTWALAKTKLFLDPGAEGAESFAVITPVHKAFSDGGVSGSELWTIDKLLSFSDPGAEGAESFGLIKARSFADAGPEGMEMFTRIAFSFPEYLQDRVEVIIIKVLDD